MRKQSKSKIPAGRVKIPVSPWTVTSDAVARLGIASFISGDDMLGITNYLDRVDKFQTKDFPNWKELQVGHSFNVDWDSPQVKKVFLTSGLPAYLLNLGGGWTLRRYSIERDDPERIRILLTEGVHRDTGYGEDFTALSRDDDDGPVIWMSDTRAEIREHLPAVLEIKAMVRQRRETGGQPIRVLINGLGLGVITNYILNTFGPEDVGRIDLVEIDETIIRGIKPLLAADDRLHIHHANAYTIEWKEEETWDYAWHDIWPSISDENLPGMEQLFEKYDGKVRTQDAWQYLLCRELEARGQEMLEAMKAGDWDRVKKIDPNF